MVSIIFALLLLIAFPGMIFAQEDDNSKKTETKTETKVETKVETKKQTSTKDPKVTYSPIIKIAGGLHNEKLSETKGSANTTVPDDLTYVDKIVHFGMKGKVGKHVTFRTEVQYEMGVSSRPTTSHGPMGTGAWSGNASMSLRDNWVAYTNYGIQVSTGIITDPGSVDFMSSHAGGLLYGDTHTRIFALYTGYNRGQGVLLRIDPWEKLGMKFLKGLSFNYSYVAGNPASNTGSLAIEGAFESFSSLNSYSASSIAKDSKRYPASDVYSEIHTPSLVWKHKFFELYGAAQFFEGDLNADNDLDKRVKGNNFRGGIKLIAPVKPMKGKVSAFFSANQARTKLIEVPTSGVSKSYGTDIVRRDTWHTGIDVNVFGNHGIGFWYFWTKFDNTSADDKTYIQVYNIAGSYYINKYTDVSLRYAEYKKDFKEGDENTVTKNKSIYLTMRLQID